ncbi:MAG TPA: hypothetical protein VGC86_09135 [Afipia sp.]
MAALYCALLYFSIVMRGLDRASILGKRMDCRVKPGNDIPGGEVSIKPARSLFNAARGC